MTNLALRIDSLTKLAWYFGNDLQHDDAAMQIVKAQHTFNPWLIESFTLNSSQRWAEALTLGKLETLSLQHPQLTQSNPSQQIAILPNENIPFAGLHELICCILANCKVFFRNINHSSDLLKHICNNTNILPDEIAANIHWVEKLPKEIDKYIVALHSDTQPTLIEYFAKRNSLLQHRQMSVAIIQPNDTKTEYSKLAADIFENFGLGPQNVRKLFVPQGFIFDPLFESLETYQFVYQYNRYANNFDYNKSVLLMDLKPFLENGFVAIRESTDTTVPVGCIYFEYYTCQEDLLQKIKNQEESIYQYISSSPLPFPGNNPGEALKIDLEKFSNNKNIIDFITQSC